MHLPFDLPIAPALFYRRDHSLEVALEPGDEALQLRDHRRQAFQRVSFETLIAQHHLKVSMSPTDMRFVDDVLAGLVREIASPS